MDGFPEYKLIQKRLDSVEREVTALRGDVDSLVCDSRGLRSDMDRLVVLFIGDEEFGLPGIVERIKSLEAINIRIQIGILLVALIGISTLVMVVMHAL